MNAKKKALGRGLSALLDNTEPDIRHNQEQEIVDVPENKTSLFLKIEQIESNPYQPRTYFDEQALLDLAESIKSQGIIQPITVRAIDDKKYQIISGERRFKASQLAGLTEIPVYVREATDIEMREMALVENIQREDLNAIEVALGYQQLMNDCKLTQEEIADKVGKNRTSVTNYLRLLKLPEIIQHGIIQNKISMGHARALLAIEDTEKQIKLFQEIIQNDYSVRKVEELVKNIENSTQEKKTENKKKEKIVSAEIETWKSKISQSLGTPIEIVKSPKGKGNIIISFSSQEEFNRLLKILSSQHNA